MAQDIIDGFIPEDGPLDVEEVYKTLYADHELFVNFPFSKERYKARLDTLRKAVKTFKYWADFDSKAIASDLLISHALQTLRTSVGSLDGKVLLLKNNWKRMLLLVWTLE